MRIERGPFRDSSSTEARSKSVRAETGSPPLRADRPASTRYSARSGQAVHASRNLSLARAWSDARSATMAARYDSRARAWSGFRSRAAAASASSLRSAADCGAAAERATALSSSVLASSKSPSSVSTSPRATEASGSPEHWFSDARSSSRARISLPFKRNDAAAARAPACPGQPADDAAGPETSADAVGRATDGDAGVEGAPHPAGVKGRNTNARANAAR